jgi:transposase
LTLRSAVDVLTPDRCGSPAALSAEEKGRIVAESYAPGAVASEVARRHEITSQHLFAWRKASRQGRLVLPADEAPMFVPVVAQPPEPTVAAKLRECSSIAIEIGGMVVRAEPGVDLSFLCDVLRAVKAVR